MARGWESKSVEEQQSEASQPAQKGPRRSPAEQQRDRERESLRLMRARVLRELQSAADPRRTEQLRRSLDELDRRMSECDRPA